MKKLILFLLVIFILVITYFSSFGQQSRVEVKLPSILEKKEKLVLPSGVPSLDSGIYQCNVDEDCVLVPISTCCGFVSVNKNFRDEIKPTQGMCLRLCYTNAVCNKGVCRAIKSK